MKILYFTSTGNSLYIAKRLEGELLSIPQLQKDGIYEIVDKSVGIICPVHWWGIPHIVKEYIEKVVIKAEYVFAIITFGAFSMSALSQMKILFENHGIKLHYSNEIEMIDNYLPMINISEQIKMNKDKNFELKIDGIINDINKQKHSIINHIWLKKFISKIFHALSIKLSIKKGRAKNFILNDFCNGCGTCRNVCPVGNITGSAKPEYQNKCEFCLACIHHCPKNAIHLKNEKSGERFINSHIKLIEIINANKQNSN